MVREPLLEISTRPMQPELASQKVVMEGTVIIGSVKSNVAHGEMGAHISSVVKVAMMLERKQILPNGYFKKPSSKIQFENFGFGGSCGHTVLREHDVRPVLPDYETLNSGPYLFAVGGLSPRAVNTLIESYKADYGDADFLSLSEHARLSSSLIKLAFIRIWRIPWTR
ncbi:hypothetical protein MPER_05865 [Moniliophthora perniciosa FA553]|nr:hypothetical protein MPER_05865 [Moniliophthora perniciosa FA553]